MLRTMGVYGRFTDSLLPFLLLNGGAARFQRASGRAIQIALEDRFRGDFRLPRRLEAGKANRDRNEVLATLFGSHGRFLVDRQRSLEETVEVLEHLLPGRQIEVEIGPSAVSVWPLVQNSGPRGIGHPLDESGERDPGDIAPQRRWKLL